MKLLRFRLRTLMIAVAVVATLFGGAVLILRDIDRSLWEFYSPGGTLDQMGHLPRDPK
jgi:hypothetical protein